MSALHFQLQKGQSPLTITLEKNEAATPCTMTGTHPRQFQHPGGLCIGFRHRRESQGRLVGDTAVRLKTCRRQISVSDHPFISWMYPASQPYFRKLRNDSGTLFSRRCTSVGLTFAFLTYVAAIELMLCFRIYQRYMFIALLSDLLPSSYIYKLGYDSHIGTSCNRRSPARLDSRSNWGYSAEARANSSKRNLAS